MWLMLQRQQQQHQQQHHQQLRGTRSSVRIATSRATTDAAATLAALLEIGQRKVLAEAAQERAAKIEARAVGNLVEGTTSTSATRPSYNREEAMQKLKCTTWLGKVIALQSLLDLVSQMSFLMQKANVVPWELTVEQRKFYENIVRMHAALRKQPKESDPRWMSTPPEPIPASIFPFFHQEPDRNHHPRHSHIQMLISGTYTGMKFVVPENDIREGATAEEIYMKAAFDLSYDIADWLECAIHFFHVRFLWDEDNILWTTNKCLDFRLFAPANFNDDIHQEAFIDGIYGPLN